MTTVTKTPQATEPASASRDTAARTRRSERRLALVFLIPTVGGLALFTFIPIVGSLVLAFFKWDVISSPKFVGLSNFIDIVADGTVRRSFLNTILFVVTTVILQLSVALGLAALVQSKLPGWLRSIFRSVFFFPLILSAASVSIMMSYLFNQQFGLVNWLLGHIGIPAVPWLNSGPGAIVMVILVYVWQNFGFSFLLFLGGLASIPREVYEAAAIDGASGWRQFSRITLPLVSPTILVASVMAIIASLQIFDQPYVLTRGGPGDSTRTAVMVIYESAFQQLQFGRASAIGLVLTVLIMLVTAVQFRLSRRFVFYS
ncbi:Binding-protein-dependent transport systems inner membrane component [Nostocoides japonicum T1-X7]|uniref:Binding-protein-dependent transport systems inner membrane component n=1 Tax=Nostocoides japonicum T1-X7 TaxID=1194083 RepID=A0A077LV80_9MICO|nr:sugar ABC transporter permease [Tetrasphaera japonica]CCH75905.1 Binding-protein-dependent transport systems inner membrane component [Tetrasphaera japonica T1-X7]